MKILAFQGFRYTRLAGDPGALAAPPFDQIDDEMRDRLHRMSGYQFAHLTRPPARDDLTAAEDSAKTHDVWLERKVVKTDEEPSVYPYAITLAGGDRRLGLCCLVNVAGEHAKDLRPHEHTVAKPLANRLALLEASQIDYEPVFCLADDDGSLEEMLQEDCAGDPLVNHRDAARSELHQLYMVSDTQRIVAYQALLAGRGAAIADGHHRTKVAQLYAEKHGRRDGAAACKMVVLTSVRSHGLSIDPIHRLVAEPIALELLRQVTVKQQPVEVTNGTELAAAVAQAAQPAVGVFSTAGQAEVWLLDPAKLPPATPGGRAQLSVVLLHHQLLPAVNVPFEAATDGRISYQANPETAFLAVQTGKASVAFFLPPMSAEAFATATEDGSVLPPKSTRFLPKLVSGLVWCGHGVRTA